MWRPAQTRPPALPGRQLLGNHGGPFTEAVTGPWGRPRPPSAPSPGSHSHGAPGTAGTAWGAGGSGWAWSSCGPGGHPGPGGPRLGGGARRSRERSSLVHQPRQVLVGDPADAFVDVVEADQQELRVPLQLLLVLLGLGLGLEHTRCRPRTCILAGTRAPPRGLLSPPSCSGRRRTPCRRRRSHTASSLRHRGVSGAAHAPGCSTSPLQAPL